MADFEIVRASRSQARLRLGLTAPSGGGKTWSGLLVAKGIVEYLLETGGLAGTVEGKIGVIDTERNSAQLYSHLCPFDTIALDPPYTVDRYLSALRQLERAGYAVVVIDQVTHAWSGAGGILEIVDRAASGMGANSFNAWSTGTPEYQRFVDGLLSSSCHLICTMRQKTKWDITERQNKAGKLVKTPVRIGMAPEQRAGFEYEFTTLLGLEVETHAASVLKDRSGVFPENEKFRLDEAWGRRLGQWFTTGAALEPEFVPPLEQLQAVVKTAATRFEQVANGPDLARVFEAVWRQARRIAEELEASQAKPWLDALLAAKDQAKARFPDLGAVYAKAGAPAAPEPSAKPFPSVGDKQAFVDREAARRHPESLFTQDGPPPGVEPTDGGLATMEDDLPWKD